MERKCTTCGSLFEVRGLDTMRICKECNCARVKAKPTTYKLRNRAQQRAKRKNIFFDLKAEDITIPDVCPILGLKLKEHAGKVGGEHDSPSLDRIDNSKGYVKSNVQVISHIANRMKFSATPEELLLFADWIYATYNREDLTTLLEHK